MKQPKALSVEGVEDTTNEKFEKKEFELLFSFDRRWGINDLYATQQSGLESNPWSWDIQKKRDGRQWGREDINLECKKPFKRFSSLQCDPKSKRTPLKWGPQDILLSEKMKWKIALNSRANYYRLQACLGCTGKYISKLNSPCSIAYVINPSHVTCNWWEQWLMVKSTREQFTAVEKIWG